MIAKHYAMQATYYALETRSLLTTFHYVITPRLHTSGDMTVDTSGGPLHSLFTSRDFKI